LKHAFWQKIDEGEVVPVRSMVGTVLAIGFERTGDADFLTAGHLLIEAYLDPCLVSQTQLGISASCGTEEVQAKPCAMAYRGLQRLLGALDRQGQLDRYDYAARRKHSESPRADEPK
jgi:hypothetical protein